MNDYFGNDEYWKENIHKNLEEDIWIDEYKDYFNGSGLCLDLGCGIGQFTKRLMEYGYDVISSDISDIALNKVKEFNKKIVKADMRKPLQFDDEKFDLVFANLSIHYFSDEETRNLLKEIKRILKDGGLLIGSVNGIQGLQNIKDTAEVLDHHFYLNKGKYIRLFDKKDLKEYLNSFDIIKIEERETIRFNYKKNYIIFIAKKDGK